MTAWLYILAIWVFIVGLYGVISSKHLVHLVICLSVAQSATYVLLIAIGYRIGQAPPIFADHPPGVAVDAIVQALSLTDIVVEATVSALLLALSVQVYKRRRSIDPDQLRPLHEKT